MILFGTALLRRELVSSLIPTNRCGCAATRSSDIINGQDGREVFGVGSDSRSGSGDRADKAEVFAVAGWNVSLGYVGPLSVR